tara:strand:- start:268 stop:573 length:306 start_codon:yes stop_codon:yes gene_type:complete
MTISKIQAITSLVPKAEVAVTGAGVVTWVRLNGETQPTEDQITAEINRLTSLESYQKPRRDTYPPLTDFADAMYWNSKGDSSKLTAYYAACEKVKSDNPKP